MDNKEYLTKEKFEEFKKELAELKGVKRKEVAESLEYAKALGDLSENAEYHEARDMQAMVEDRIAKLESLLKNASIVSNKETGGMVNIGSVITVQKDDKKFTYTIVGSEESDVVSNKISIKSPFGQAVLGKKKGEEFSYSAPNGELKYKLVDVK
jgi:transcription elongation factor GreA